MTARLTLVLAGLAFAALLLPAASPAAEPTMHLGLPASNGYTLRVKTEGSQAIVSVWRHRPGGPSLSSTYYANNSAGPEEGVVADLGAAGKIDLRFTPNGETKTIRIPRGKSRRPGCRYPERITRELGTFTGTIAFHGEHGFATAEATTVPGSVGPSARPRCGGEVALARPAYGAPPSLFGPEHVRLLGSAFFAVHSHATREDPRMTYLLVSTDGEKVLYFGARIEVVAEGLAIQRTVEVSAPRSSFSYSGNLSSATLRPPAPFSGTGTYSARRELLGGDLAVALPGADPLRLTGRDYDVRFDAGR
ncbi:MAG TPA: hypothetical protein VFU11_02975 [Solirubrobacterales bacterium]|nr:hypothetical protein [Solirubrobacterales bacterium]